MSAPSISPLAPKGGFPDLPAIAGVRYAAAAAGIRYKGRDDVMLIEIAPGASVAGVFTTSSTRAAPVLDCEIKLASQPDGLDAGFAIIVNSGNANAFTGHAGQKTVDDVTHEVAAMLALPQSHVFSASTGVIGQPLPSERIIHALATLRGGLSADAIEAAARAFMTTDTFAKGAGAQVEVDGHIVKIAGIAKGSGMIAPDMATMLVYIFTDAKISQPILQSMLNDLNAVTFNAITVDGDTSTSDTLMIAATGVVEMPEITSVTSTAGIAFAQALGSVMKDLALQVVRDGEGATKLVEIRVTGATSDADAVKVARSIANSPLVKTAIAGEDPNWGRIVMAVGKSGAVADRDLLKISFGDVLVAEKGWVSATYSEEAGAAYMRNEELLLDVDLGLGAGSATVWTCDLTHAYITINADYRS
jgi:glutamate N-acetyltransferase/amino-acid N-acetyltransferase